MNLKEIKRLGNKIFAITHKIEECEKNGMTTRIPGYVEQLGEIESKLSAELRKLEKSI